MEINASTTIANLEIGNNKAQTGLDVLTRTLTKIDQGKAPLSDSPRVDVAKETGKGQHIDIKA